MGHKMLPLILAISYHNSNTKAIITPPFFSYQDRYHSMGVRRGLLSKSETYAGIRRSSQDSPKKNLTKEEQHHGHGRIHHGR
jgi:hypothetical protein